MIWEVGVLLAGIGVLFFGICGGIMLRDFGVTIRSLTRISVDKKGEIESILDHSAAITENLDTITENAAKVTSVVTIATEVIKAVKERQSEKKEYEEGEN